MAHAHRTARGWLILLTVLLVAFVATVVWVVVSRNQGADGATATTVSEEQADGEAQDGAAAQGSDGDDAADSEENGAANGGDGWFTEDQASRGGEAYAESCASCHGPELGGGSGPALTGDAFWDRWEGDTVHTFFEVTSQTMPQDDPGSLPADTYADITAHVLHVNGFPTGDEELPPDEEHLTGLAIEDPASGGEGEDPQAAADEGAEGEGAEERTDDAGADDAGADAGADDAAADDAAADADAEGASAQDGSDEGADGATASGDGWFAQTQIQAGGATYAEHCARCHGADLQGDPPLAGGGFAERYGTVWALYQYVQQTMPLDQPGSLSRQAYLDAVSYILDENGYPMGDQRHEPVRAALEAMDLDTERAEPATGEGGSSEDGGDTAEGDDAADGDAADDDATAEGDGEAANEGDEAEGASDADDAGSDDASATDGGSGDGHYDQEQADRGQEPFAQHCAECHGDDLQGQPPLTGASFLGNFESVWDLFEYTRDNMPQGDPGSLDDETYGDIVAYVLSENDLPDGGPELGPDQEDAMQDLPLDAEAGDGGAEGEGAENGSAEGEGSDGEEGDSSEPDGSSEADGSSADEAGDVPALASLEIDARPANLTINVLGPDGLARRAVGAQTLTDLQPGLYVVAGSRGHEGVTVNVRVAAGETARVRLVLDELSRSADVPEEPAVPTTEIPAIAQDPGDRLIGATPDAALGSTRSGSGAAPNTDFAAGRGQQAFDLHCARCHGADLEGNVAPALAGDVFFERWGGHPVDWFFFQARAAMPPHGPASLDAQTYADIVVYVLTTNGVLEGFESFAPGDEAFRNLVIERRDATEERVDLEDQVDRLRETLHGPQEDDAPGFASPVRPVEWPDDPGVAPIGKEGDPIAPTASEPESEPASEPEPEQAPGEAAEPESDEESDEEPDAEPADEDEGRVDDADRSLAVERPTTGRSAA